MNPLHFLPVWFAVWAWAPAAPEPNAELLWGQCYREVFARQYPDRRDVQAPLLRIGSQLFLRQEALICREDLMQWLNDPSRASEGGRWLQHQISLLRRQLLQIQERSQRGGQAPMRLLERGEIFKISQSKAVKLLIL